MKKITQFTTILLLSLAAALFLYWAKCQFRIDVFKSIKWENYLPLQHFQRPEKIVGPLETGFLFREHFESGSLIEWAPLWSRAGEGRVFVDEDQGRHAVRIEHSAGQDWSFQRDSLVEVIPGQSLDFGITYRADGPLAAGVILYDTDKRVLGWHYGDMALAPASDWSQKETSIVIPEQARFIRFRVSGTGENHVLLDDIFLKRSH